MKTMYLGIDVGGTKTLVASLDDSGIIQQESKFPTPKLYSDFLKQLKMHVGGLNAKQFMAAGIGLPGRIDREHGVGEHLGNLPLWINFPIQKDLGEIANCPVVVENDAKLGGLSEAMLEKSKPNVLYVAIGTGIGVARIMNGVIDVEFSDGGGHNMLLERNGKMETWESFASGHAIYERFGQKASDIDDDHTWQIIAHDLSLGIIELIAIVEPDIIILGGGVGTHFPKYEHHLNAFLHQYIDPNPLVTFPIIKAAERPEKAVVYGCYDLAKSRYGSATNGA